MEEILKDRQSPRELLEKQVGLLAEASERAAEDRKYGQLANLSEAMVKVGALLMGTDMKTIAEMMNAEMLRDC